MGSIDRRLKELEASWYGDAVHLEQLDGSVRTFHPGECWGAVFSACLSLSFKKPDGEVFEALRGATDESKEMFLEEFGPIESGIVGRSDEGIWVEVVRVRPRHGRSHKDSPRAGKRRGSSDIRSIQARSSVLLRDTQWAAAP